MLLSASFSLSLHRDSHRCISEKIPGVTSWVNSRSFRMLHEIHHFSPSKAHLVFLSHYTASPCYLHWIQIHPTWIFRKHHLLSHLWACAPGCATHQKHHPHLYRSKQHLFFKTYEIRPKGVASWRVGWEDRPHQAGFHLWSRPWVSSILIVYIGLQLCDQC